MSEASSIRDAVNTKFTVRRFKLSGELLFVNRNSQSRFAKREQLRWNLRTVTHGNWPKMTVTDCILARILALHSQGMSFA